MCDTLAANRCAECSCGHAIVLDPLTVHAASDADDEVIVGTLSEEDLAAVVVTDLEYR